MKIEILSNRPPRKADSASVDKVKRWVRETLGLNESVLVLVNEIDCGEAACGGLETSIIVTPAPRQYFTYSIRKPIIEISQDDVAIAITPTISAH